MSTIQIHQFPTIPQAPADADVLAIEVNGITYKVSKAVLASAIIAQLGGDPVTVAHGGTGSYSASGARTNLSVYSKTETDSAIQQSTADKAFGGYIDASTWSELWTNCLSKITQSQIGFVGIFSDSAASVLSNGKVTSLVSAIIWRGGSDSSRSFRVMAMSSNGQYQYSWQITSATSSTRTTGTVYRFAGTAL